MLHPLRVALSALLLAACSQATPATSPAADTSAPASAVVIEAAAPKPDPIADCTRVLGGLEVGPPSKGEGVNAANIVPDSPADRDAKLGIIDGHLSAWKRIEPLVLSTDVRAASTAYVAALTKQRGVVASLKFEDPPPPPPPPPQQKPTKPVSKEHVAREAALRDAAAFGMEGLLNAGPFLGPEERARFNKARGEYLEAWQPLLGLCDR